MSRSARLIFGGAIIAAALLFQLPVSFAQPREQKPAPAGAISGRVTIAGKPAPGIVVAAFGSDVISRRMAAAKSTTDSDGRYRLSGLPSSQYQISALSPDLTADEPSETNFGNIFLASSKIIALKANEEVENIDLKLVRGGVITGRVTDADDKPVIEERVSLQPVDASGNQLRSGVRLPMNFEMYQTDDRGIYRIFGLPAGRYKVSVGMDPGGGNTYSRGYYTRTFHPETQDAAKAQIVELHDGSEASDIDIRIGRRENTYRATGRVVEAETGQPITGARISYMIAPTSPERYSPFMVGISTGPRGDFQISGLTPGHYGAYISSEYESGEYFSEPAYFDVVDKDVSGIEIKGTHGSSVSGVVIVEGSVAAVTQFERLRVSASVMQPAKIPNSTGGASSIAADGSFHVGGLRPGRVNFYVYPAAPTSGRPSITRIERGGVSVGDGLDLQAGTSVSDLRIFVTYGSGVIRGTVRFEGGALAPDARVIIRCKHESGRDVNGSFLDSRASFVIRDLAPGTYELTLQILRNLNSPSPQRPPLPQKQLVTVTNDAESEVTFVVDLTPKTGP